jgi:hypothetical protein
MILSLLLFVLVVRAALRSYRERFPLGAIGGAVRAVSMIAALAIGFDSVGLVMMPGIKIGSASARAGAPVSPAVALLPLVLEVGGPILSLVVAYRAWKRFQDVPAAQEEALQRPFDAWLPPAILDALVLAVGLAAVGFAIWA